MKSNLVIAGFMVVLVLVLIPIGLAQFATGPSKENIDFPSIALLLIGLILAVLPSIIAIAAPVDKEPLKAKDWRNRSAWYVLLGSPVIGIVIIVTTTFSKGLSSTGGVIWVLACIVPLAVALFRFKKAMNT